MHEYQVSHFCSMEKKKYYAVHSYKPKCESGARHVWHLSSWLTTLQYNLCTGACFCWTLASVSFCWDGGTFLRPPINLTRRGTTACNLQRVPFAWRRVTAVNLSAGQKRDWTQCHLASCFKTANWNKRLRLRSRVLGCVLARSRELLKLI